MKTLIKTGAKATGENWRDNWQTPDYIREAVDGFFGDNDWYDPCPVNPDYDALSLTRDDLTCKNMFINPPFSQYKKFVGHILPLGGHQLWLMHHDHSTERMQTLLNEGSCMCLLYERVKFIDPRTGKPSNTSAVGKSQTLIFIAEPFDSSVSIGWWKTHFEDNFQSLGRCIKL